MSTRRARELWRHRETGERYLVEVEEGRVISAHGPLSDEQLSDANLAFAQIGHGRMPAFTEQASELERRRDEFESEAVDAPSGRPSEEAAEPDEQSTDRPPWAY